MTGDMGCLTWQRNCFPKTPDYGFPFDGTGIDYFAEKIVRADGLQVIKSWQTDSAISDINKAMQEDRNTDDIEALSYVFMCLEGFESGDYGYFQMSEEFNNLTHNIESEEWCEYGRCYSEHFRMMFELLRSVSNMILYSVAERRTTNRGYFVKEKGAEWGIPVVATSTREAKRLAFGASELDCDWIDIRITWMRNANVDGLTVGVVSSFMDALRRGIIEWLEEGNCDIYDATNTYLEAIGGDAVCGDCMAARIAVLEEGGA
jgi:hypothetical protein